MTKVDDKEWHYIGNRLTDYLGICSCQRKLKSIVDVLISIYEKAESGKHGYTPSEFLICAMLEKRNFLTHGINCEYPIIDKNIQFWIWIVSLKDNPNLTDN